MEDFGSKFLAFNNYIFFLNNRIFYEVFGVFSDKKLGVLYRKHEKKIRKKITVRQNF